MTTNRITADTITDDDIRALRTEAAAHGDRIQVEICDLALAPHEDCDGDGEPLIGPAGGRVTRTDCRGVCAAAINEARARS